MNIKMPKVFGANAGLMGFILGVTLIAFPTFVEVPDPVSNGTGIIQGAEGLQVTGIETELVSRMILNLECGWDFERYVYNVKISVVNETAAPIYGAIVVNFHNPAGARDAYSYEDEGRMVDVPAYPGPIEAGIPIFVEIAAGTTKIIEDDLMFDGIVLLGPDEVLGPNETHTILVTTGGSFISPYGGGTGRVPITEWLTLI